MCTPLFLKAHLSVLSHLGIASVSKCTRAVWKVTSGKLLKEKDKKTFREKMYYIQKPQVLDVFVNEVCHL
jgi:hypothetical protein